MHNQVEWFVSIYQPHSNFIKPMQKLNFTKSHPLQSSQYLSLWIVTTRMLSEKAVLCWYSNWVFGLILAPLNNKQTNKHFLPSFVMSFVAKFISRIARVLHYHFVRHVSWSNMNLPFYDIRPIDDATNTLIIQIVRSRAHFSHRQCGWREIIDFLFWFTRSNRDYRIYSFIFSVIQDFFFFPFDSTGT